MSVGLFLLSRLTVTTSSPIVDLYLLVLGLGLGMVMQVLVLAVQNAVDFSAARRSHLRRHARARIGGSLGAAVFGTIFSSRLRADVPGRDLRPARRPGRHGARLTGEQVAGLPRDGQSRLRRTPTSTRSSPVFLVAAAIGAIGFLLSLFLRERPLRATARQRRARRRARGAQEPRLARQIDRALGVLVKRPGAAPSTSASPHVLGRPQPRRHLGAHPLRQLRHRRHPPDGPEQAIDEQRIAAVEHELRERALVEGHGERTPLTARRPRHRRPAAQRASRGALQLLADHSGERPAELQQLLERLCLELSGSRP